MMTSLMCMHSFLPSPEMATTNRWAYVNLRRQLVLVPGLQKLPLLNKLKPSLSRCRASAWQSLVSPLTKYCKCCKQNIYRCRQHDSGEMRIPVISSGSIASFEDLKRLQVGVGSNNVLKLVILLRLLAGTAAASMLMVTTVACGRIWYLKYCRW